MEVLTKSEQTLLEIHCSYLKLLKNGSNSGIRKLNKNLHFFITEHFKVREYNQMCIIKCS